MKNVKEYAAPALVLFIIGLIATLLLGVTNDITAPKIAALAAETEKKSRQIVFADAADFGEVKTLEDGTTVQVRLNREGPGLLRTGWHDAASDPQSDPR